MIPLQLKLRNFLSYGSHTQTINFEPYHLLCLSGKNGHGKSALLDAITWVLWGQARKTGGTLKADEGLLRLGQSNMMVSLDFLCNGQRYRVTREFVKTNRKAYTELNFGIARSNDTTFFTPISEKTSRITQQKIISVLGLDYNSCINSMFLRQGQSNEFSKKSSKERKEILATILGLNRYDSLKKQATEKARDFSRNKEQSIKLLTQVTEELQQKITVQADLTVISKKIIELTTEKITIHETLKKNSIKKELLIKQQNEATLLEFKFKQTSKTIEQQLTAFRATVREWRSIRKKQRIQKNSTYSPSQKEELEKQNQKFEIKRADQLQLKEDLLTLKEERSTLQQKLHTAYTKKLQNLTNTYQKELFASKTINNKLAELAKKIEEKETDIQTTQKEIAVITTPLKQFEKINAQIKLVNKSLERHKAYYHHFVARGNRLSTDIKNLQQKKSLCKTQTIEGPSCPLCEQALSNARKKFLYNKFTHQEQFFTHQLNRLKQVIPKLKAIMIEKNKELEKLLKQQAKKTRLTDQKTIAEKQLKIAQDAALDLIKQKTRLLNKQKISIKSFKISDKELNDHQKQSKTYHTENNEFKTIEKRLEKATTKFEVIGYNLQQHDAIKKQLQEIYQQRDKAAELLQQISLQKQRKEQVHNLSVSIKTLKQEQEELSTSYKRYANCKSLTQKLSQEHEALTAKLTTILNEKDKFLQKKGALEQQIKRFEKQEFYKKKYEKQIKEDEINLNDYQIIAQSLGKNGIQALLIENAIPEIEHEANVLLSHLTDNQSHIIIESVRDLKSGGTKETLDIKISDAVGIRPYELFSGGEAFRIDFAIRIAISKLLARRSGTSLQTLIIDEGFGSQDEEGLNHIMEALYKIQDDFAKIIIVSHLPTMKNQFPTHFFVQKDATGSSVSIVEQG